MTANVHMLNEKRLEFREELRVEVHELRIRQLKLMDLEDKLASLEDLEQIGEEIKAADPQAKDKQALE